MRTTVLLAEAQFNVDNTKSLAGTGTDASWRYLKYRRHLRSHHDAVRADRNHAVIMLADIYIFKQSVAATRIK